MRRTLLAIAIAGCASAGKPSFGERPDSGIHIEADADTSHPGPDSGNPHPPIDAPPTTGERTLTETNDNNDTGIGIACGNQLSGYTSKNSYYRVFALSDFGITGSFSVSAVDFLVAGATNSPSLKVSVGTYGGAPGSTLTTSMIQLMSNATVTPADTQMPVMQHVPLTASVPAGGNLIVEVDQTVAGTATNGIAFYPGANPDGESKPGYIMSTDCSVAAPTSMTQVAMTAGGGETDLVLTVTGNAL